MKKDYSSNYDSVSKYLADSIYKQIKRKPAYQTESKDSPIPADISFTIESENKAEYQIMEKVSGILDNKRIKTYPSCNPVKVGYNGCIATSKEKLGEKTVFHFTFCTEEISYVIS